MDVTIFDKAKWQIEAGIPANVVIEHFNFIFKWLNVKGFLSQEGKEDLDFGIDSSISLSSLSVTLEGKLFLEMFYNKYIEKIKYGQEEKSELLDSFLTMFRQNSDIAQNNNSISCHLDKKQD